MFHIVSDYIVLEYNFKLILTCYYRVKLVICYVMRWEKNNSACLSLYILLYFIYMLRKAKILVLEDNRVHA